jgi:septum formation topological specificity factor MinE
MLENLKEDIIQFMSGKKYIPMDEEEFSSSFCNSRNITKNDVLTALNELKEEYIVILCDFFDVSSDYLLGLSYQRKSEKTHTDKEFSAFYENYKDLDEEHKNVLRTMLKAFVDSKKDDK